MIRTMDGRSELTRTVYETVFETWRSEVDSYWQRNSYFAAFEIGALAGCWYVVEKGHVYAGAVFSVLGLLTAIIWLLTSIAVHTYIDYWWRALQSTEATLSLQQEHLDFASKHPGSGLHPSLLIFCIPALFGAAWIVVFFVSLHCGGAH